MNAHQFSTVATRAAEAADIRRDLTPRELIAGPCALPDAPLNMPRQTIERREGLIWRTTGRLGRQRRLSGFKAAN